jgi:5-amino-6-(5-phosphoribosylamino)uracil reductase
MAMSMDGKIATKSRGPVKLGSAYDSRRMAEIRAEHDVVINGASTFAAYPKPLHIDGDDLVRARTERGLPPQPISAIVSSRLDIPRGTDWENAKDAPRWAFCGKDAPASVIAELRAAGVRVEQMPSARPSPSEILGAFKAAGVSNVLVEGGGEFNASFLEADLVDDVFLTLVPILVGGAEAPTWCEGVGFSKGKFPRFELAECRNVEGELYLHYRRQ